MIGSVKTPLALSVALVAAFALSGCGKSKKPPPPEAAATAPAPPAGPPMPPLPGWAAEYIGKPLQTAFPGVPATCAKDAPT